MEGSRSEREEEENGETSAEGSIHGFESLHRLLEAHLNPRLFQEVSRMLLGLNCGRPLERLALPDAAASLSAQHNFELQEICARRRSSGSWNRDRESARRWARSPGCSDEGMVRSSALMKIVSPCWKPSPNADSAGGGGGGGGGRADGLGLRGARGFLERISQITQDQSMKFKEGDRVEVLRKNTELDCSWFLATILSVHGNRYAVKCERFFAAEGEPAVEKVRKEDVRPPPPPDGRKRRPIIAAMSLYMAEVLDVHSWRLGKVAKVLRNDCVVVRLFGSIQLREFHVSQLRIREAWRDDRWVAIDKVIGGGQGQTVLYPSSTPSHHSWSAVPWNYKTDTATENGYPFNSGYYYDPLRDIANSGATQTNTISTTQNTPNGTQDYSAYGYTNPEYQNYYYSYHQPTHDSSSQQIGKRKRPARIDIPAAEAFDPAPAGSDGCGEVEAESARFSVYS